jgi:outer membrane immunogenic protein
VPPTSIYTPGLIGGLQLGYNFQFNGNWLVGLETDFDGSGMKGSGSTSQLGGNLNEPITERVDWFGTVRARLGYLPTSNLLAYVTGGFAYGRVEHSGNLNFGPVIFDSISVVGGQTFSVSCTGPVTCYAGSSSGVDVGWTLGGGLEYALWQQWTIRAEYLYVSLQARSLTESALMLAPGSPPGTLPSSFNANYGRTDFNVVRLGLNYRFW